MSTPSRPPASAAPRQLTIPLPLKIDPHDAGYRDVKFASSSTHLALGYRKSVWIYSLPTFDLIDTIEPGYLSTYHSVPLRILETFLVAICRSYDSDFGDEIRYFLCIWDLPARKRIGIVICNSKNLSDILDMSVSLSSAEISEDGTVEGTSPEWPQNPVLIVTSPTNDKLFSNLEIYVLHFPGVGSIEGGDERTQEPQFPMAPRMTIYGIHPAICLASMGSMALTGGKDGTVHAWDIVVGKCQMVFIGHTAIVDLVDLNEERIYSSSYDCTIRVWDRHKGACLHVLEVAVSPAEIFVTPSYIIAAASASSLLIWDIVSGKLEHKIDKQWLWDLDPIRGKDSERTLSTMEVGKFEDSIIYWFRIWDLRSGRPIWTSSFEPGVLRVNFVCQGRFLIGVAEEDEGHALKVWDFGANSDSLDIEVGLGNDDSRSSTADMTDKTEGIGKDDGGKPVAPFSSSSVVEGTSARGSAMRGKGKREKSKELYSRAFPETLVPEER